MPGVCFGLVVLALSSGPQAVKESMTASDDMGREPIRLKRLGWCRVRDLNPRPSVYKTAALPLC